MGNIQRSTPDFGLGRESPQEPTVRRPGKRYAGILDDDQLRLSIPVADRSNRPARPLRVRLEEHPAAVGKPEWRQVAGAIEGEARRDAAVGLHEPDIEVPNTFRFTATRRPVGSRLS